MEKIPSRVVGKAEAERERVRLGKYITRRLNVQYIRCFGCAIKKRDASARTGTEVQITLLLLISIRNCF